MIPVVDIFAGPGGLSEGFSAFRINNRRIFRVVLSIEKDVHAWRTLLLRSFFREFDYAELPDDYYRYLRGEISLDQLFSRYPEQAEKAMRACWLAELGKVPEQEVDGRIRQAIGNHPVWVLVGGPPCQPYSIAGRSRMGGINPGDRRVYLYTEYRRILAEHRPAVFIFENVRGLTSSAIHGVSIFNNLVTMLQNPSASSRGVRYRLYSPVQCRSPRLFSNVICSNSDFIVRMENFGVPQARHRVIILGVREDFCPAVFTPLLEVSSVPAGDVLYGLPELRSGISGRGQRGVRDWAEAVTSAVKRRWIRGVCRRAGRQVLDLMMQILNRISDGLTTGSDFIPCRPDIRYRREWFIDERIGGVCNHRTRSHMLPDLHRYLYAACFAAVHGRSPRLSDFPPDLLPKHNSARMALRGNGFWSDRFRVQLPDAPATTITSHLARDGHYYIHPDPVQCRSLTVREAARLQTFPDNYYFEGPMTEQFRQVGNAVPPLLSLQLAKIVYEIIANRDSSDG